MVLHCSNCPKGLAFSLYEKAVLKASQQLSLLGRGLWGAPGNGNWVGVTSRYVKHVKCSGSNYSMQLVISICRYL